MGKSLKPKDWQGDGQSPYRWPGDDGGRGTDDAPTGTSVVSDVKGGTGSYDGEEPKPSRRGSHAT
jgi:hypothetical protein